MRISCILNAKKIPRHPNIMFVSIIKEALKKEDKDYYAKLYQYNDTKNKEIKNFTFSYYLNKYELGKNEITLNSYIILNVSTSDYLFGIKLYNGLIKCKDFRYKQYILQRDKIIKISEKNIKNNEDVFKTLSPICIKDKKGVFLNIDDKNFNIELNYICNEIVKKQANRLLIEPLQFTNVLMDKVVVKEDIKDFLGNKDFLYVNSYKGIFKLKGNKEDLNILLKTGIGFRRSQGFGMIDKV